MTSLLLRAVRAEVDRCAVGRDNPTHRRLVAGELSQDELKVWAVQQWLWHRAFPGVLAALAANCPLLELRQTLLHRAAVEDGALPEQSPGRCAEWALIAHELGVEISTLEVASPSPETEAMIAIQHAVAARPFGEAWIGIMVGVDGETLAHSADRRRALQDRYGVPQTALGYIRIPRGDVIAEAVATVDSSPGLRTAAVLEALRLVLHARWNYFSALAHTASAGFSSPH